MQKLTALDARQEFYKYVKLGSFWPLAVVLEGGSTFYRSDFYFCPNVINSVALWSPKGSRILSRFKTFCSKIANLTGPLPMPESGTSAQFSSTGFQKQPVILSSPEYTNKPWAQTQPSAYFPFARSSVGLGKMSSCLPLATAKFLAGRVFLNKGSRCLVPLRAAEKGWEPALIWRYHGSALFSSAWLASCTWLLELRDSQPAIQPIFLNFMDRNRSSIHPI